MESDYSGFEDVMLVHNALPELSLEDVDTSVEFLGKKLSAPIMIASMTGGHRDAKVINRNLAIAVEELGLGMGVGSQRAAIEEPDLADSFIVVREYAPKAFVYANIGVAQLLEDLEVADKAVEMIDADALAIHLNFLQEAVFKSNRRGLFLAESSGDSKRDWCRHIEGSRFSCEKSWGFSNRRGWKRRDELERS